MNKKITALLSACAVTVSMMPVFTVAHAVSSSNVLSEVVADYAQNFLSSEGSSFKWENNLIKNINDVEVKSDMKARKSDLTSWYDLVKDNTYSSGTSLSRTFEFDYQTTLYMDKVLEEYNKVTNLAKGAISVECAADTDTTRKDSLLAQLESSYIENAKFTITVSNDNNMTLPDSALNGSKLSGFTAEKNGVSIAPDTDGKLIIPGDPTDATSGNLIFTETSRQQSGNDLIIEIATEGKTSHKALAEALQYDLVLTCDGITAQSPSSYNASNTYKLVGTVTGETPIYTQEATPVQLADITYKAVQDTSSSSLYDEADEISAAVKITTDRRTTGGGGGGGTVAPPVQPSPTPTAKPTLNNEDHYAYIIGYPEGDVRPDATISRAEVATIFFRLLSDDSRDQFWAQTNGYADVTNSDWFNNAISTLGKANILNGYDSGFFNPNAPITRAEFAVIAARFDSGTYTGEDKFTDISGHWANEYINRAVERGWIQGYVDGTFKPDQYITRAEAMTLINNVLNRHVQAENMLDDMVTWTDNAPGAWYYEAIQEATNSHYYERITDSQYEKWTSLRENRDWEALEKSYSTADSGKTFN